MYVFLMAVCSSTTIFFLVFNKSVVVVVEKLELSKTSVTLVNHSLLGGNSPLGVKFKRYYGKSSLKRDAADLKLKFHCFHDKGNSFLINKLY